MRVEEGGKNHLVSFSLVSLSNIKHKNASERNRFRRFLRRPVRNEAVQDLPDDLVSVDVAHQRHAPLLGHLVRAVRDRPEADAGQPGGVVHVLVRTLS